VNSNKMSLKNMVVLLLLCLNLIAPTASASFMLTVEGKVESMDENFVTIRNNATIIKVPRRSIQSTRIRPGQWVTAVVDSKNSVETWAAKDTSTEK
jgi:hypothetical protein